MRPPIRIVAALGLAAALVACSYQPVSGPIRVSHPAQLAGTAWRLIDLAGRAPAGVPDVTLTFSGDQFGGAAPCNGFGGHFAYDAGSGALRFDQLISTKRACAIGPGNDLEGAYFSALRTVNEADVDADGRLVLVFAGGRMVFEVAGQPVGAPATANPRSS